MTINILIKKLKELPGETQVLVQGYENGFDDIRFVRSATVCKNPKIGNWWDGEYMVMEKAGKNTQLVVVITGNPRQGQNFVTQDG